jgi:hypothetical protein
MYISKGHKHRCPEANQSIRRSNTSREYLVPMVQNKEREAEWSELTGILCVCFRVVGNPETMLSNDDSHSASNCTKTGLKASSE